MKETTDHTDGTDIRKVFGRIVVRALSVKSVSSVAMRVDLLVVKIASYRVSLGTVPKFTPRFQQSTMKIRLAESATGGHGDGCDGPVDSERYDFSASSMRIRGSSFGRMPLANCNAGVTPALACSGKGRQDACITWLSLIVEVWAFLR
jgi:hypothetical protein